VTDGPHINDLQREGIARCLSHAVTVTPTPLALCVYAGTPYAHLMVPVKRSDLDQADPKNLCSTVRALARLPLGAPPRDGDIEAAGGDDGRSQPDEAVGHLAPMA